ncbi:MAG: arginase family protein [Candidatus Limnocylindrales bacterium]
MTARYHLVGIPTALGGHLGGMERTPSELRSMGLVDRLRDVLDGDLVDDGDLRIDPGFQEDPDPRTKNHDRIVEFLPRAADLVAGALPSPDDRLVLVGGDCTGHAGAMAGIARSWAAAGPVGICWFDAHGDFNVPETTPSGNVWGMPFAMICGRGDPALVAAAAGPTAREEHAALLGGQILDEQEARMLAASRIAHFGAGMLGTDAGIAALSGWATTVSSDISAWYIAFDMDCLDESGDWSLQMPEPGGLSLEAADRAVRTIAGSGAPVVGFGATAVNLAHGDTSATLDGIVRLTGAAFRAA